MSWFSEQIEERRKLDNEQLEEAVSEINTAITGRRTGWGRHDRQRLAQNALDEILEYYHFRSVKLPKNITRIEEQLEYAMHPHGMMWREVRLEKGWYRNAAGAMLASRKADGTLTALIPERMSGYRFFDFESGEYISLNKKTEELFEREAYAFYPAFPQKELGISDLLKYVMKNISSVTYVWLILLTLSITIIGMIMPQITYFLYSYVVESRNMRALLATAVFAICTAISRTLLESASALVQARISTQLNLSVEAAAMARIFSLPPDFFRKYNSGELASKMEGMKQFCSTLVTGVFRVGMTSIFSILYIFQVFHYARCLVAPSLIITLFTMLYTLLVMMLQMKSSERRMNLKAQNSGVTYAVISGIQKIRLSGAEKRVFSKWLKGYAKEAKLTYRPRFLVRHSEDIGLAISIIGQMVLYYQALRHSVTVAEYTAFNSAYGMVSGAFLALVGIVSSIASIRPILKNAEPILRSIPETSEQKQMVGRISGSVELDHVSFRYEETTPYIINDFSMKIKKGEYIAIVGKTGCGKSTLVRLLLGFEKPQRGAVYYDGRDLNSMDLKSLRQSIGAVIQDGRLFQGDIFSNITVTAPSATMEDAWEAAEMAGLKEDIKDMPMGMHTVIAEGSGGISGGQKQRILIARAIVSKPKIVIFDEATSALDNITQKKVSQSLDRLHCTRIVIAHRLSTIQQCDRIVYMENGRISEDGNYEELIRQNGNFAKLVERQRIKV